MAAVGPMLPDAGGLSAAMSPRAADGNAPPELPEHQVADFLSVDCANIWSLENDASDKNPLYWLRGIDCADRLAPVQARAEAKLHNDDNWQDALKRGILLADAKITPDERREMVARIDSFSPQIAAQVRPLYRLWRDARPGNCSYLRSAPATANSSNRAMLNWKPCVSRSSSCVANWS